MHFAHKLVVLLTLGAATLVTLDAAPAPAAATTPAPVAATTPAPAAATAFTKLGDGHCKDDNGRYPSFYYAFGVVTEAACKEVCAGVAGCQAFNYKITGGNNNKACHIFGTTLTASGTPSGFMFQADGDGGGRITKVIPDSSGAERVCYAKVPAAAVATTFTKLGDGHCKDDNGKYPSFYHSAAVTEAACKEACAGVAGCQAFGHLVTNSGGKYCYIFGTTLTASGTPSGGFKFQANGDGGGRITKVKPCATCAAVCYVKVPAAAATTLAPAAATTGVPGNAGTTPAPNQPIRSIGQRLVSAKEDTKPMLIAISSNFEDADDDIVAVAVTKNSNPSIVDAEVINNGATLRLAFKPGQHGLSLLTVTATSADGSTADLSVTVNVKEVAPSTDAPATEAPDTEAPKTKAPTQTDAPTTPPTTAPPPRTSPPATEAPETAAPETEAPAQTDAPTDAATTTPPLGAAADGARDEEESNGGFLSGGEDLYYVGGAAVVVVVCALVLLSRQRAHKRGDATTTTENDNNCDLESAQPGAGAAEARQEKPEMVGIAAVVGAPDDSSGTGFPGGCGGGAPRSSGRPFRTTTLEQGGPPSCLPGASGVTGRAATRRRVETNNGGGIVLDGGGVVVAARRGLPATPSFDLLATPQAPMPAAGGERGTTSAGPRVASIRLDDL